MTLTTGGMIVMLLSISGVLLLLGFCLFKVFTLPPVK
ncbi:hypothetical protein Pla22_09340 [Rubripirellula amarantea]|uniref:Uncharacterized protein n=1 Tax=Rubripirellula amarantea TaxID=2527999 RepID=A0A5C5WT28_9BACT|nr:hypothetical protein Pla22_09340 [Rubripirellula amarantea]